MLGTALSFASSALASASSASSASSLASSSQASRLSSSSSSSAKMVNSASSSFLSSASSAAAASFASSAASSFFSSGASESSSGSGSGEGDAAHSALVAFLLFAFNVCLVFGPHIGYLFQYFSIRDTAYIDGYSPIVSIILLVSNTIRVFYFPGAHYALALLFQACVAIATHCLLLHKVLTVHHAESRAAAENRVLDYLSGVSSFGSAQSPQGGGGPTELTGLGSRHGDGKDASMMKAGGQPAVGATAAPTSSSYNIDLGAGAADSPVNNSNLSDSRVNPVETHGMCLGGLMNILNVVCDAVEERFKALEPQQFLYYYGVAAAVGFFSVLILFAITGFANGLVNVVGYIALGIEATLVIPQILRNARRRSTEGLTVVLVVTWVGGDIIKIIYFFAASQPLPFILCGFFQLTLDFVVVYQYMLYRARNTTMGTLFPTSMV